MIVASVDLRPQVLNINLYRGDAWSVLVTVRDSSGDAIDLTGLTISGVVRDEIDSSTSTPLTITPDDLTEGRFYFGQSAAADSGRYDIQIGEASPRTYIRGRLLVARDVT